MGIALNNLGDLAMIEGRYEDARPLFETSLASVRKVEDKSGQRVTLMNLSVVCMRTGDAEGARKFLVQGMRLVQELGARSFGAQFFDSVAELGLLMDDQERAARCLGAGDGVRQATGGKMTAVEQRVHDEITARTRSALGEERTATLMAEGRAMSFEAAVEYALRWLEGGR